MILSHAFKRQFCPATSTESTCSSVCASIGPQFHRFDVGPVFCRQCLKASFQKKVEIHRHIFPYSFIHLSYHHLMYHHNLLCEDELCWIYLNMLNCRQRSPKTEEWRSSAPTWTPPPTSLPSHMRWWRHWRWFHSLGPGLPWISNA